MFQCIWGTDTPTTGKSGRATETKIGGRGGRIALLIVIAVLFLITLYSKQKCQIIRHIPN